MENAKIYQNANALFLKGLSQKEAEKLLQKYGPNELAQTKKISPLVLFLGQFKDFIVMVLFAATLVSFFLGEIADAVAIVTIIIMNGILGFIQEYRTEKSLEALKKMSAPNATVLRDGTQKFIPAREIVPGDIIILEAGNIVPSDCILYEASNIQVNESILTGESIPVEKKASINPQNSNVQKESLIFMGTTVITGRAKALVKETGMQTEMGKIARMIEGVEEEATPLQKRLNQIGKQLVLISLGVCALIVVAGILHGETIFNMLLSGISLAVAAIPEGLPAIVTVSLAIGVQRMLKRNALIRRLPAVETLGCTNIICSDKTGTLTENKMTVKKILVDNTYLDVTGNGYDIIGKFTANNSAVNMSSHAPFKMLMTIGALCNNAEYEDKKVSGDPTEIAILIASKKAGIDVKNWSEYSRIDEIPFDSDRKRMSTICKNRNDEIYLFVKGAPDKVLGLCSQKLDKSGVSVLSDFQKKEIIRANEDMADQALRVLAFAYKKLASIPRNLQSADLEKNLVLVGLEGMIDPPRPEAIEAAKSCYKAGIKPAMITGDHKNTAVAVAKELRLKVGENSVLTGDEIESMNDKELFEKVRNISIFARVTPKHKLRIVQAFKKHNNIVAMTGDGVNDAPALKEANIGVAMGQCGTDVAKESSAMILLDDNFATIVAAIKEGRIIYDNIRKFIRYLLACNLSEILIMASAAFMGLPLPLIPIQILWINLVTDGLPALALGVDPPDNDIMTRPPRKSNESIFSRGLGTQIVFSGFLIGISSIAAFTASMLLTGGDLGKARTVVFATIIIAELLYSFESRSEYKSVFEEGFFKNPYLVFANLSSFALMLLVMHNSFLSSIFETKPLSANDWLIILGFGAFEFVVNNVNKLVNRKR